MTFQTQNFSIEILPEHIIDQIKAGEVLERPASLLKELLENSLDAHSTEIHIQLVENGMELLSIFDNGHGMSFENLPYAFLRHATSKLKKFEDLYSLHSFGFRGEALASLAASARITCTSQPSDLNLQGGKIIINGGATELLIPMKSAHHGTSLVIKDLFYNTPARLKFIKSKTSEKMALKKMLYSFILSNPHVMFSIKWDDKEKEIYNAIPPADQIQRISQVFFSKNTETEDLVFSEQSYERYNVKIFFTKKIHSAPPYKHHYFFVNQRFFQDKSLHMAVARNLDVYWPKGETGHYLVQITAPPEEIDVNVHPNKTQIKFLRTDIIQTILTTSLKNKIKKSPQPDSFFSQNEKQDFDLINMYQENVMDSTDSLPSVELNRDHAPFLFKFSEQYIIASSEKKTLIDLKKFIVHYFSEKFNNFLLSEENTGPLLISEPFKVNKGKIDTHLDELKSLGFEFDRLNTEYLILRSIPSFLPQNILFFIANSMLNYFSQEKIKRYEQETFSSFFEEHFPNLLLPLLSNQMINKALDQPNPLYSIDLTPMHFKKLFNT